jgi:hypothetical protein
LHGIYVDVGPTDCNSTGMSTAPANYQAYIDYSRKYDYHVFLLTPQYADELPVTQPWLRKLNAEYLGLWEAGTTDYQNHYYALNFCAPNQPGMGVPAWWDPEISLRYQLVVISNDCASAADMRSIAELAIRRNTWTIWITKGRQVPDPNNAGRMTTVYDELPRYWDDEVAFFREHIGMPCRRTPQVGGAGGAAFADDLTEVARLSSLTIYYGAWINGIQCNWELVDRSTRKGIIHGSNSGTQPPATLTFGSDEYIVGISRRSGAFVDQLVIKTNKGTHGPFGGGGGAPFDLGAVQALGFFGRSGAYLDAIGAFEWV